MQNLELSIIIIMAFVGVFFYVSQQKFKDKILCTFIRPNRQKIEKWVPLQEKHVVFDRGRYGVEQYRVDPECITMMWFTRGFNKFFPVLIPTLDFKWDTENPLDPKTFTNTWRTPEALHAAWQSHQHVSFAKGTAAAVGKKGRFPEWFFPLATVGAVLIVLFVVWQGMGGLDQRMFALEQQIKLLLP